jgi:histidinol dehydrogenase
MNLKIRRFDAKDNGFATAFAAFVDAKREAGADVSTAVAQILAEVRARGDEALIELTERFDGVRLAPERLRVAPVEIESAWAAAGAETRAALEFAAARIRRFHERQRPVDDLFTDELGVTLGSRWTPIDAVGFYVPGGSAAYPSTVLMNAVPASVAGALRIVMVTPAREGTINPLVLAAARLAGVHEIYRLGGAQAIAALAFGTSMIAAVDKIVGPGNAYVAEAKRQVFGRVGIDLIAGPSEVVVVADGANEPTWIAYDLLAQAEHDAAAQSILITDDAAFADAVVRAIEVELRGLARGAIARASLEAHGAIIVISRLEDAPALINALAPEHLELAIQAPEAMATRVRHAGAIFLGRLAPEAIGDYVAGTNHVLPTARSARFASGLSVADFMKRTSVIGLARAGLDALGSSAVALARAEGLTAHARSITVRTDGRPL